MLPSAMSVSYLFMRLLEKFYFKRESLFMIHLPIFSLMYPPIVEPSPQGIALTPTTGIPVNSSPAPWSTGLCDCCDDVGTCLITCLCPCITFGRIAEIIDRGSTSCGVSGALYALICCLTGCHWVYSCFYRSKMRGLFFLEESPCPDCLIHFCCDTCALCQEYRELKNRGYDMQLGWKGNLERQRATIPPAVEGCMARENVQ